MDQGRSVQDTVPSMRLHAGVRRTYCARVTVLEAIQRSADFLTRKEVDSPRLQAELLLAHVLGIPRMKLYLNFDRALVDREADAYRELVQRRGRREPLQHILGTVQFHGVELAVSRDALIPRPETELLVEQAITLVRERERNRPGAPIEVVDFGTGSGCIAIALAVACPQVHVRAIDISPAALDLARANGARHNLGDRVEFIAGDSLGVLDRGRPVDVLVSNPPYIASGEIATLQPEVRDYDPRPALDGGADGLDFYRMLSAEAGVWMAAGGVVLVEFGDDQGRAIGELFSAEGWAVDERMRDYSGRERILIARRTE